MQVTEHVHALRIPFKIPISPEKVIDRYVYSYIVFGDKITLIDSGVLVCLCHSSLDCRTNCLKEKSGSRSLMNS